MRGEEPGTYVPRVLVISKDAGLQSLLVRVLAKDGYPCLCSRSSLEAQRHLERGGLDIVFVDAEPEVLAKLPFLGPVGRRGPIVETIAFLAGGGTKEVAHALRLGAFAALAKPIVDVEQLRRVLRLAVEKIRFARKHAVKLEAMRLQGEALERLVRSTQELTSELFALYTGARTRGLSLDLGTVQTVSAAIAARLFGQRETFLFRYHRRDQCLRGRTSFGPPQRRSAGVEIQLSQDEVRRFLGVDQRNLLADRIRHELRKDDALVALFGHSPESCGVIVVVGSAEQPLGPAEADLLHRFGDFLSLSLAGAQLYKEVLDLSAIDGLTGLYNHRFFQQRLGDEVARAARYARPVSLLFCDIDDFKLYNDRNGHAAGDDVLATLGQIFRNDGGGGELLIAFRESDVRARYGGEEFAVILPETPFDRARSKAERLREAVAQTRFPRAEGQPHGRLTMSIGISEYPRHAGDKNLLVETADQAMYRAKQLGKNRVESAP